MKAYSLLIAFGAGAALGSLLTRKIVIDKYEEALNEELEVIRKHYKEEQKSYISESNGVNNGDNIVEEKAENLKENYIRYSTAVLNEEAEKLSPGEGTKNDPYLITPEQYDNELLTQDKITLIFYDEDEVLADEYDERVNISNIGEEALRHFGEYHDDTVYVRNERLGADYEVVRKQQSYAHDILGEPYEVD